MKKYNFFKAALMAIVFTQITLISFAQTGESLDFGDPNDKVYLHGDIDFKGGDWTVEFWFIPAHLTQNSILFSTNDKVYAGVNFFLTYDKIYLMTSKELASWKGGSTSKKGTITKKWHHIAIVFKKLTTTSVLELYLDGTQVDAINNPVLRPSSATYRIFSDPVLDKYAGTHPYLGRVDELRIWKTARSAKQISNNKDAPISNLKHPDLKRYYNFDDGIPNGDNSGLTKLPNLASSGNIGASGFINYAQLAGFSLMENSGNLVSGSPFSEYIIDNSKGGKCFKHDIHTGPGIKALENDKLVGQTFRIDEGGSYTLEYLKTALYKEASSVCDGPLNGSWANIQIYEVEDNTAGFTLGKVVNSSCLPGRTSENIQVDIGINKKTGVTDLTDVTEWTAFFNYSTMKDGHKITLKGNKLYAYVENSGGSANHTYAASSGNPIDCTDCFAFHIEVSAGSVHKDFESNINVLNQGLTITPSTTAGLDLFFHLVATKNVP